MAGSRSLRISHLQLAVRCFARCHAHHRPDLAFDREVGAVNPTQKVLHFIADVVPLRNTPTEPGFLQPIQVEIVDSLRDFCFVIMHLRRRRMEHADLDNVRVSIAYPGLPLTPLMLTKNAYIPGVCSLQITDIRRRVLAI